MKVTKVKSIWVNPHSADVLGEFDITLDGAILIHKMCVINGKKGIFVSFPNAGSYVDDTGRKKYLDVVHPVDSDTRISIVSAVLECFEEEVAKIS